MNAPDFIQAFYQRFTSASPEVAFRFENTDFTQQVRMLERSLLLMARAVLGEPEGIAHLEGVAASHSKRRLNITPSLYELWLDALIETARDYDTEFDARVESAWKILLGQCVDKMIAVYRLSQTAPPRAGNEA